MVVVASWSSPNSIRGRTTALGIEFGVPVSEAKGPKRRMAWIHPFAAEDREWIGQHMGNVEVLEELPADWRYPEIEL